MGSGFPQSPVPIPLGYFIPNSGSVLVLREDTNADLIKFLEYMPEKTNVFYHAEIL